MRKAGSVCIATLFASPAYASDFSGMMPFLLGATALVVGACVIVAWLLSKAFSNRLVSHGLRWLGFSTGIVIIGAAFFTGNGIETRVLIPALGAGLFGWFITAIVLHPRSPKYDEPDAG